MKLYRFVAPDNHKAMQKVNAVLGPDAFVYATSKVADGVEMLAGFPHDENGQEPQDPQVYIEPNLADEVQIENLKPEHKMIENLNVQLQVIEENIRKLTSNITSLYQVVTEKQEKKKFSWDLFKYIRPRKKSKEEGFYGS